MSDEATRSIPTWLAAVVQKLELGGEYLITLDDVARARPELDRALVRQGIAQLIRRGWLRPVGVRGAYEFMPGAAAGPYPSGDPWLVLRAELRRHAGAFHVGAASAAWLLGYAQRSPAPHLVVATPDVRVPRPLAAAYRVLRTDPAPASGTVGGLPVPTPPELFAEVARLAPRLALDAARGWLRRLLDNAPPGEVATILRERGVATRARAGYLADTCGAAEHAAAIAALGPLGDGPFYTGPRRADGSFSPRWRVYDTNQIGAP